MLSKTLYHALFITYLIVAFSGQVTMARPVKSRTSNVISLPLRRVLHPQRHLLDPKELHRLHANHAEKRLAKLSGRAIPSDDELLAKRAHLARRFDRTGVASGGTLAVPALALHDAAASSERDDSGIVTITVDTTITSTVSTLFTTSTTTIGASPTASGTPIETPPTLAESSIPSPESSASSSIGSSPPVPSQNGAVKLENIGGDVGYFAVVQIGTPARDFKVLMDSGSADFWVGSQDNCTAFEGGQGGCGDHVFLGTQSSSSFKPVDQPFEVKYGSGHVVGTQVTDLVTVAGMKLDNLQFGLAEQESSDFADAKFDGLMGLAKSTLSNHKLLSPLETLAKQGTIAEAIVSYKMSREADKVDDGTIDFGGLDESKFDASTLTTIDNVSKSGFWEAALDSISVNGQDLNLQGQTTILDTGTTLMVVPAEVSEKIHAAIPGSQAGKDGFELPCDTDAVVSMTFGGRAFDINPLDLTFNTRTKDLCTSGIVSGNNGDNRWLVGDTFLKNVYFSTNANTDQISLAKLV